MKHEMTESKKARIDSDPEGAQVKFKLALWLCLAMFALTIASFVYLLPKEYEEHYKKAKIRKQVIWETDLLRVLAQELDNKMDGDWPAASLTLQLENLSQKAIHVDCLSLAVNNAAMPCTLSADIPAGSSSEQSIAFTRNNLYDMTILTIGSISLELRATDSTSGKEIGRSGTVTIRTNKELFASNARRNYKLHKFCDERRIQVGTIGYFLTDAEEGRSVGFYAWNKMGRTVQVSVREVEIDGTPFETETELVLPPETKGIFYLRPDPEELKEQDLSLFQMIQGLCIVESEDGTEQIAEVPFQYAE